VESLELGRLTIGGKADQIRDYLNKLDIHKSTDLGGSDEGEE